MSVQSYLLDGQSWAIAYSGYREGQGPNGEQPSDEQIVEDLRILMDNGFGLIRVYGSRDHGGDTVRVIAEHDLPMKVLLGTWLEAEISNHDNCPWLHEPIPQEQLEANKLNNEHEIAIAIELANRYPDVVASVSIGNEALVHWNDHMVELESVMAYVRQVKAAIEQPITVAENYDWWAAHGAPLAELVDYIGVHTYASWEHKSIDDGMPFTIQNLEKVRDALPDKPMAILEAGWATKAVEFHTASYENQRRYYNELKQWAEDICMTVFFFEAYDEPWKGDPANVHGAEKHWGVFYENRSPKLVLAS